MFSESTVVILGAGSSAEFGLPTGRAIFDHITVPDSPSLKGDLEEVTKKYSTFGRRFSSFYKERVGQTQNLGSLLKKGQQGYHQSIDQLATRNRSLLLEAKLLSTWCILSKMYHHERTPYSFNSDYKRIVPSYTWRNSRIGEYRNWVGALVEKYREAGASKEELLQNQLSIITFNYDTLFADAFMHFLKIDEDCESLTSDSCPNIVHVFGSFGDIIDEMHPMHIESAAERISFMEEKLEEDCPRVKDAQAKIKAAKKILLVGFDCDPRNVTLMKLNDSAADIYAINYDGNEMLNVKLREQLNLPDSHIMSGTAQNPIGVSAAFENGFLAFPDRFSSRRVYEDRGLLSV